MRVKLLTFRYSATIGGFDDTPLVDFTRDKEVIAQREHFYLVNDTPHLTLLLTYQDAIVPRADIDAARAIAARPPQLAPDGAHPGAPWGQGSPSNSYHDRRRRDGAPDPCAGLDENERALFNHLREWRSRQAHEEGLPPFLLFTNKHLVAIVRKRPDSLTALGHIDGVGPGKVERCGPAILACVHGAPAPTQPAPASNHPAHAAPGDSSSASAQGAMAGPAAAEPPGSLESCAPASPDSPIAAPSASALSVMPPAFAEVPA
ncbi:MAG: HRDC domain-containing protein [Planctomycetes bacterium]|nr:HRDC domain-containing protein [Planctomycetota bacterium]